MPFGKRAVIRLEHGGHIPPSLLIRAAHHVATGEDFGLAVWYFMGKTLGDDATTGIGADARPRKPGLRIGTETEGDNHAIGGNDFFRAGHHLRVRRPRASGAPSSVVTSFTLLRGQSRRFHRLAIPQELHALFFRVRYFAA